MANPAPRGFREGPYDIGTLNKVFAVSSIAMLISLVLLVWDDYAREWKHVQGEFREIEIERAETALAAERARLEAEDAKRLGELEAALAAGEKSIASSESEIARIEAEMRLTNATVQRLGLDYANLKSEVDALDYEISVYDEHHDPRQDGAVTRRKRMKAELDAIFIAKEEADTTLLAQKEALAKVYATKTEAEAALAEINTEAVRLEGALDKIAHKVINDLMLDAPLLDFVAPTLKIDQIVLPHLQDDLYFAKIYKVDRCQTCHLAIDRAGYGEEVPEVFRTHPNLDLYMSATSKHPKGKFGCTICHDGMGHAVDFVRVAHMPDVEPLDKSHQPADDDHVGGGGHGGEGWFDRPDRERWHEELDWHQRHHWAEPMVPLSLVEARCMNCHATNRPLEGADTLNAARKTMEKAACYGCHKIRGYDAMPKPAPPLTHVGDKLDHDWVFAWLKNPRHFRPSTYMPRFFDLDNVDEIERYGEEAIFYPARQNLEALAITDYLYSVSGNRGYQTVDGGDAEAGEASFHELGCAACHVNDGSPLSETDATQEYGPELSRMAEKLASGGGATWVYNWVRDPKHYYADGNMPNLRLTEDEAKDIAAYITSLKKNGAAKATVPFALDDGIDTSGTDPRTYRDMLRALAIEHLRDRLTASAAEKEIGRWKAEAGTDAKLDARLMSYVGERTINHYGCFGCHDIPGFEGRLGIGAELSTIGSKILSQFDFGHVAIEHSRMDWIAQKLDEPRIFDVTKIKAPRDKLKMPKFGLTKEEVKAITMFLLGLTDREVGPHYEYNPGERQRALTEGRHLIEDKNCIACHYFEVPQWSLVLERDATEDEPAERREISFQGLKLLDTRPLQSFDYHEAAEEGEDPLVDPEEPIPFPVNFELWSAVPSLGLPAGATLNLTYNAPPKTPEEDYEPEPTWLLEAGAESIGFDRVDMIKSGGLGGRLAEQVTRRALLDADGIDLENLVETAAGENELTPEDLFGDYGPIVIASRSFIPPVLNDEGEKVQPRWVADFLREPYTLRPQVAVRMPNFHLSETQIRTLSDYFQAKAELDLIAQTEQALGVDPDGALIAGSIKARVKEGAYVGKFAQLTTDIQKVLADNGAEHFFQLSFTESALNWTINPALLRHDPMSVRHEEQYLLEREKKHPGWLSLGRELFEDASINCASCHVQQGRPPGGEPRTWAPDLGRVRFRLTPSWVERWIANPKKIVPSTNMPSLFPVGEKRYQEILPLSREEQIAAIRDYLMTGLVGGVESVPRDPKAGSDVVVTSSAIDLASVTSVKFGDRAVNEGDAGFVRVKGRGGRTTALRVRVPAGISGTVWLECTDGRYVARTRIDVQ